MSETPDMEPCVNTASPGQESLASVWSSVAPHIQDWYEGLLRTSEVYSQVETHGQARVTFDAMAAARSLVAVTNKYHTLGLPAIRTRERENLPVHGLGEKADAAYRLIGRAHREMEAFLSGCEDEAWNGHEDGSPQGNVFHALDDFYSCLRELGKLNSEAMQLRTQAWRTEMRATVPHEYIRACGFAEVRVQGYSPTKTLLGLYRAGIPAEWLGAFMPWERTSSQGIVERVAQAHAEGIPAEYMVGLL